MISPSANRDTTKPLLHSILQTETAAPFTKKPSSVYQIEFTSHIYNPEAINSMATSSYSTTFMPTKPSIRPASIKATTKASSHAHSSFTHAAAPTTDENEKYFVPEVHMGWPVYNLIIEGHSKVKTYGSKNDDPLGSSMPKIRPIQPKENPIVEHVTDDAAVDSRPEYGKQKIKKTAMTSLLSLLDGSFGNFLGGDSGDGGREEEEEEEENEKREMENKKRFEGGSKRKTRSVQVDSDNDDKQEQVVGVSFQVDDVRPQIYRMGTVVSESLWPFQNADTTR
jgi:hypothetical protein